MAWYRFTAPARQTDYIEFGIAIGNVFEHLKTMGIGVTSVSVRQNKLCFDTTTPMPADLITHLGGLEAA